MENSIYEDQAFKAITYTKKDVAPSLSAVDKMALTSKKGSSLALSSADDIPLFFYAEGKVLGAMTVSKDAAIAEEAKKDVKTMIVAYNLKPSEVSVYMGPCLTFSHTIVSREELISIMNMGYRACAKRTDGVDFLDVPLLVMLQLRALGIPMANFHVSPLDTYENPDLLYSKLRGDEGSNLTIGTLK